MNTNTIGLRYFSNILPFCRMRKSDPNSIRVEDTPEVVNIPGMMESNLDFIIRQIMTGGCILKSSAGVN